MVTALPPKELRTTRRQRSLLTGVGAHYNRMFTFECAIRDLSPKGARLRVGAGNAVPSAFHLVNVRDGLAYEAKVAWRKDGEVGVSWSGAVPLKDCADPHLSHLRKYLFEKLPR